MKFIERFKQLNRISFFNKNLGKSQRYTAFTLAEVLITLGIIGIVAEMTIPDLIQNTRDQVLKVSFKKAYSVASQAWEQVVAENPGVYTGGGGAACTWPDGTTQDYNTNDGRTDAIKSKMKVVKTCIKEKGCWPDNFEVFPTLGFNDDASNTGSPYYYSWINADGMCWAASWYQFDEIHLLVDTNCNSGPNKIGQDMFSMLLGADGVVYFYIDDTSTTGKPVSSGNVCPYYSDPTTINGRTVSFRSYLSN